MADMEPFTLVEEPRTPGPHHLFEDMRRLGSGKTADHDLQYQSILRNANPDMIVTGIPMYNMSLRDFAAAGHAICELDQTTDSYLSHRGYVPPALRQNRGQVAEAVYFAKYHYQWKGEDFLLYTLEGMQYVLKERRGSEHILGPSKVTDALVQTIGDWMQSDTQVVWVYDRYWMQSKQLYYEVMRSSWDKVILDEAQKEELTTVANKFFSSRDVYEDLGVPWKRGLLFYGPPGNGKTISIKALMHTLLDRKDRIPTLYVKTAPTTYDISQIFYRARALSPCMLVLEDIETIVTPQTRSYFFNEMDGLENNDGMLVVASTNFLDKLDPGLKQRPSRFDRKYSFPLPNEHERILYCQFWRRKLKNKPSIDFPEKLCPAMAHITAGFSFAFLQECFVATLLVLARDEVEVLLNSEDNLDDYKLWVTFKEQAEILRKDVDSQSDRASQLLEWCKSGKKSLSSPGETAAACTGCVTSPSCVPERHGGQCHRPSDGLQQLRARNDQLPELPYLAQKMPFINSKAYEYRVIH